MPQYKIDMRDPSSDFVYHLLRRNSAPGKKAASTKPKKKRVNSAPTKLQVRNKTSWGCRYECEVLLFCDPFAIVLDRPWGDVNKPYAPVMTDKTPDRIIHVGRYIDGFPTWLRNIFLRAWYIKLLGSICRRRPLTKVFA